MAAFFVSKQVLSDHDLVPMSQLVRLDAIAVDVSRIGASEIVDEIAPVADGDPRVPTRDRGMPDADGRLGASTNDRPAVQGYAVLLVCSIDLNQMGHGRGPGRHCLVAASGESAPRRSIGQVCRVVLQVRADGRALELMVGLTPRFAFVGHRLVEELFHRLEKWQAVSRRVPFPTFDRLHLFANHSRRAFEMATIGHGSSSSS